MKLLQCVGPILLVMGTQRLAAQEPLELERVLRSVDAHHPTLEAAVHTLDAAQSYLTAARGAFDPNLDIYGSLRSGGYYELRRMDAELRQATPFAGTEFHAGYRLGRGIEQRRYPTYYDDETRSSGEFSAGLEIPLLYGRDLDTRRANRTRAHLGIDRAEASLDATRLQLRASATDAYFRWVTAVRTQQITGDLLQLAEDRKRWVERRVQDGAIAAIEELEADRSLLRFEQAQIKAAQDEQTASFSLSIFLRDERGAPRVAKPEELPPNLSFPPGESVGSSDLVAATLACHPRLIAKRAEVSSLEVQRRLQAAIRLPRLNVQAQVSRDFGDGDESLPGTVFETGLKFAMPLGMRTPRGRYEQARFQQNAAERELQLLEERMNVQLEQAVVQFRTAAKQQEVARLRVLNAQELRRAEHLRFEAGATTLIFVNQREMSYLEAAIAEIRANQTLWHAYAYWSALTACATPTPTE
ncbi:MAG: TolC family protein [Myxococcota bacterium]